MRKIIIFFVGVYLSLIGLAFADMDSAVLSNNNAGAAELNQFKSYSTKSSVIGSGNSSNNKNSGNELYIIQDGENKNAVDINGDNNSSYGNGLDNEIGKNQSESSKNSGGGNKSSEIYGNSGNSNNESNKNDSGYGGGTGNNNSNQNGSSENQKNSDNKDNSGYSNKEQQQNDSTQNNKDNQNETDKNDNDGNNSGKPDPNDNNGNQAQPHPDDDGSSGKNKGDERGRVDPSHIVKDRSKGANAGSNKMNERGYVNPSDITGNKIMFDHTAGDGSGVVDPNQSGNNPDKIGNQKTGKPKGSNFDNGNLKGKGFGNPNTQSGK